MIRFIARPRGKVHVDVAIRTGETPGSLALCGNLCMGVDDWRALCRVIERGRIPSEPVEIHEPTEDE